MKEISHLNFILFFLLLESCSGLYGSRSISSVENSNNQFFSPHRDFPALAGDRNIYEDSANLVEDTNNQSTRVFGQIESVNRDHERIRDYFRPRLFEIGQGMSKTDIKDNFGQPIRVEIAGNPSHENERWLYNVNGAMKYIYFESGRVDGWE